MKNKYIGKKCPYCKKKLKKNDTIVVCNTCMVPHHLSCWQANEGCTTPGCSGSIDIVINQNKITKHEKDASNSSVEQIETEITTNETSNLEIIYNAAESKLQNKVPILIEKITLLKNQLDDTLFAQCAFRSLTNKSIKAILLDVVAWDIWGNVTEGVEGFQLLDLKTSRESVFGQATLIPITNRNVRSIDIVIKKLLFEDQGMEECEESYTTIPTQSLLIDALGTKEAVDFYAKKTTKFAKFVPVVGEQVWRCTCGATNAIEENTCYRCNIGIIEQQSLYQPETIIAETKRILEENRKKEETRIAQKRETSKKRKKRILLSLVAIILIAGAVYGIGWHLIPLIRYNQAASDVKNNEFDSAYNTYIALGDYKDSADKAIETIYKKAEYLENQEQFTEAANEYKRISSYQDSDKKASNCRKEADYREAIAKFDAKDYDGARKIFKELAIFDYSDSKEWLKKSKYMLAENALDSNDYYTAYSLYYELDDYEDCIEKKQKSQYLYANECMTQKKYKEASDAFDDLRSNNYEDSEDKCIEASYFAAKDFYDSKNYESAVMYFERAGDYEDSISYLEDSKYEHALELIDNKDYINAVYLLGTLGNYKDSKDKINEAKYAYVKANKKADDLTTYNYLKALKDAGYSDSTKIYNDLYAWKVKVTAINNSEDGTNNCSSLRYYDDWYFHFKVTGGTPNGSEAIYCKLTYGGTSTSKSKLNDYRSGGTGWVSWGLGSYNIYNLTGTCTIYFYDSKGNKIGEDSVTIN